MKEMLSKISARVKAFAQGDLYALCVLLLAYGFVVFECEVGAFCAMMAVLIVVCVFSDDLVPMILPLFLLFCVSLLSAFEVEGLDWLFYVFVPLAGAAVIYRFVRDIRHARTGPTFWALVAVTAAVTLGGLFSITPAEYFSSSSLYHVLGLGIMTPVLYLFFSANVGVRRDYDAGARICSYFYLIAVFVAFLILRIFLVHPEIICGDVSMSEAIVAFAPWRNSAAALVVMCMPFLFYFARKNPWHFITVAVVFLAIVLSGSRGALVIGGLQLVICGAFYVSHYPYARRILLSLALVTLALVAIFWRPLLDFCEQHLRLSFSFDTTAARPALLIRSVEDFLAAPLFGRGLGYTGNKDIFSPTYASDWQIRWYHSLFPQIFGSLGLFGALCYGFFFFVQARLVFSAKRSPYTAALSLSLVGLFLYSQIDPGYFSPLPFAAFAVLLMVLLEARQEKPLRLFGRELPVFPKNR